jgi:hypothetical protein
MAFSSKKYSIFRSMKRTVIASLFILLITSCEKLLIEGDQENTRENNFDLLWTTIDRNYSFFELKNINWDSIYHVYRPLVSSNTRNQQFSNILVTMLAELRDGHVNLYSEYNESRSWEWFQNYPNNFNFSIVENNYLNNGYMTAGPIIYTERNSVGYIYIGSFAGNINEEDIDQVIEKFHSLRGIIIDVRNNSGGFSSNGRIIASRFADRKRLVSYTLYKTGPGHGEFSEPQPNYISPDGKKQYNQPVVVLANRKTYSAANDFVLSMSVFPHVTIMGGLTGGGGGTPYEYELLNGWRFRFPRTQSLAPNGFNIEMGINPDIFVNLIRTDEERGVDTIIEAAIRLIDETSADIRRANR